MDKSINRIELRGNIGKEPQINEVSGSKVIKFPLATNETYKDRAGNPKIETCWHNIVGWAGKGMPEFEEIKKGMCVSVTGRIRNTKYTTQEGEDKYYSDVLANRIAIEDTNNL